MPISKTNPPKRVIDTTSPSVGKPVNRWSGRRGWAGTRAKSGTRKGQVHLMGRSAKVRYPGALYATDSPDHSRRNGV